MAWRHGDSGPLAGPVHATTATVLEDVLGTNSPASPAPTQTPRTARSLGTAQTALTATVDRVRALAVAVEDGRLSIDPQVGEQLLGNLRSHADQVDNWLTRSADLARPLPLGSNPVGDAMAGKFARRVRGDTNSLGTVLERYAAALAEAEGTLRAAMGRLTT